MSQGSIAKDADIEFITDMLIGPLVHRTIWQIDPVTDEHIEFLVDTILAGLHPTDPSAGGRRPQQ